MMTIMSVFHFISVFITPFVVSVAASLRVSDNDAIYVLLGSRPKTSALKSGKKTVKIFTNPFLVCVICALLTLILWVAAIAQRVPWLASFPNSKPPQLLDGET